MPSLLDALLLDGLADSVIEAGSAKRDVFIALRKDDQPGRGTESDPYDGSRFGFDLAMHKLGVDPEPTDFHVVRLGPGTFLTKGSKEGDWRPHSGQRIIGSGISTTTLESLISRTCCEQVEFCPSVHLSRILQSEARGRRDGETVRLSMRMRTGAGLRPRLARAATFKNTVCQQQRWSCSAG